jgi:hypothetical protein
MTKAAGLFLIGFGLVGWIAGIHDYNEGLMMVGNGLGFIGLRRATDKAVAEIAANQVNPASLSDIVRRNQ